MTSAAEVGCDGVSVSSSAGNDHAAVLFAFPALDPATFGVLTTESENSSFSVLTIQVGKAATVVTTVAFGSMIRHWVRRGIVTTTLLVGLTIGITKSPSTTTLVRLVAGRGNGYQTK